MPKYWITGELDLTSDTFGQKIHYNNNRKDIFIHELDIVLDPTDYSEAVADKPVLKMQITKKTETAIVPLSPTCRFRLHEALIDIINTAHANSTNSLRIKLDWHIIFSTARRLTAVENIFFGFESIFAGKVSFAMLVSDKNVT